MGLTKAYIELVEANGPNPPTTGARSTRIEFQFNPKEFRLSRSAHWEPVRLNPQGEPTAHEYKGPEPTTLSLEMFLYAADKEDGDVSEQVEALLEACAPTEKSRGKGSPLPAFAIFGWDKVYFRGFIRRVDARFTMFRESGKPIRAVCTIELTETPPGKNKKQNPTSGSQGAQAIVQLVDGDSLAAIAYREYGDATKWRAIAEANSIDDPLRIRPGTRLLVPSTGEVGR